MPVNIGGAAAPPLATPQQFTGKTPGFIKTGDAGAQAFKEQEAARAAAQEAFGRLWRWYIGGKQLGQLFRITFLDGFIDPTTKLLQNPVWLEHTLKNVRGNFDHYMCTDHKGEGAEPCPLCMNDKSDKPATVMGFTILDHRPVTFEKGDRAGTTVQYTKKLLVAKSNILPVLQAKAAKLGGLRGFSFDVMRTSATAASVGDQFELVEQYPEQELVDTFKDDAKPANWEFELNYKTAEELVKLGVAPAIAGVTQGAPSADYTKGM